MYAAQSASTNPPASGALQPVTPLSPGVSRAQADVSQASSPYAGGLFALENGLTFNNADRLNGAAQAAAQYLSNKWNGPQPGRPTPGQAYTAARDAVNAEDAQFSQDHPYLSAGLSIAGSLPLMGPVAKSVLAIPSVSGKIAAAAGSGALTGAAYGAGADKTGNISNVAQSAITGGATGAVAGPLSLGAGKLIGMGGKALAQTQIAQDAQALVARYLDPSFVPPSKAPLQAPIAPTTAPGPMTAAARAQYENTRLNNPLPAGPNPTTYVPGVQPTAGEVAGNPTVSQIQKITEQTPGNQTPFVERQQANNDARLNYYDDIAGSPTAVAQMEANRTGQMNTDLARAWANKAPVDATPVLDTINSVLNGPEGKVTAVRNALTAIRSNLSDANGNLESDPQTLYGVRKDVANMLGKNAVSQNPTLKDAAVQLGTVKNSLDSVIEQGAPGYSQYLQNFAANSRPIDAASMLLDARPDLTNGPQRQMTFPKFDRFMKGIVSSRQSPGVNAAKSIPDDTMEKLWNLHADLARTGNLALGNPSGSPTSMLHRATKFGIKAAVHGGIAYAGEGQPIGFLGNLLAHGAMQSLEKRATLKLTNKLLNPGAEYLDPNYRAGLGPGTGNGTAATAASVLPGASANLAQQYLSPQQNQ